MLGSIGPLCPECGETTEPASAPPAAGAIDARGQEDAWPKLDKPAQVDCSFGVGVSTRLVVEAAQRRYERESANRVKTLADALNDPRPMHEQIAEVRRRERPSVAVLNMMVGVPAETPPAAGAIDARGQEVEWLHEMLRRSMGYVKEASTRYYDGTDGASMRASAASLFKKIEAALASRAAPQASGDGETKGGAL